MIDVIKLSTTMQHAPSRHEFTSVEHMFTNNTWSGILYRCWKLIVVFNPWKYFQFLKGGVHTAGQYSHLTKYVVVVDPLHWPTKQQNQRRQTRLITWAVISTLSPHAKLPVTSLLLLRKMKMSLHRGNINLNLFDHHSTNLTFAKKVTLRTCCFVWKMTKFAFWKHCRALP